MKKFKYPVRAIGSKENLLKWAKELLNIGYECGVTGDLDVINGGKHHYSIQYIDSIEDGQEGGRGLYIWAASSNVKLPYTINVDKEYDLALAIASQVDDNIPHIGEWVKILGTGFAFGNEENFPKDALFRIEKVTDTALYCHVDRESNKEVLGANIGYEDLTKATAEEIIAHFRKEKTKPLGVITKTETMNRHSFKKGDKVIFTKNTSELEPVSGPHFADLDNLKIGDEYIVGTVNETRIGVEKGYLHSYDMFELVPEEVKIYENYAVWAETREEAQKLVDYQKELFGSGERVDSKYNYRICKKNKDYGRINRIYGKDGKVFGLEKELSFEEWEKMIKYLNYINKNSNMKQGKEVVGYKLIKEYPGCPVEKELVYENAGGWHSAPQGKGGSLVRNPEDYPEIWEAVFEDEEKTQEVIVDYQMGSNDFTLKVSSKGYIEVVDVDDEEGTRFDYADLKRVLGILAALKGSKWTLVVNYISIGCKDDVSLEHLEKVMEVYEKLNNIK